MANEYGELEQLVNDVTSLDTARMTLRWALERLQNIEKEKADLRKNLTLAEETAKKLQVKDSTLQDAYSSRAKTLEEKEDFYTKLEATMSLMGEGKLDIQQLLKKEAKLDSLRKSLENEYQEKFEDLDRSQRSIIERWNTRLLEVEGQYAGRLSEAQKKYDSLRAELEADYQGRLAALEGSFKAREKDLSGRISLLEGNVLRSEEKVEVRRRELEAEYLAKKREAEENYRKLKTMLEAGLEEKVRAMDSDHAQQVRQLEASWQAERSRLLEEQGVREQQFLAAQERIKEIENNLAAQQERHHGELLKLISDKEAAFRSQLETLEKEKTAQEATVKDLQARLEEKAAAWESDRARLQADFDRRAAALEQDYSAKKGDLDRIAEERRAGQVKELESGLTRERRGAESSAAEAEARLSAERAALDAERARFEKAMLEVSAKFEASQQQVAEMGAAMRRSAEEHAARENELRGEIVRAKGEYEAAMRRSAEEHAARENELRGEIVRTKGEYEAAMRRSAEERAAGEKDLHDEIARTRSGYEAALRKAAEEGAAREAEVTGELLRAKGEFDRELSGRLRDAVVAQTASLVEALETVKAEKDRLSATMEEDFRSRCAAMEADVSVSSRRLAEENAALKAALDKVSDTAAAANARAAEMTEKLLSAEKAFHDEKLAMQREQVKEMDHSVDSAVAAAVEMLEERLQHAHEELAKIQKSAVEEMRALEENFEAERARMVEDTDRRDRYIEIADSKIQDLEREMLKLRQESATELMRNISDQDKRFRDAAGEEKARAEARIGQLEDLLSAKERLMADRENFFRQKQLEMDKAHAALNEHVNAVNGELFSQKQALADKEKSLNEFRLKLEKEQAVRLSELEQMKSELTRAIIDYKGRK